MKGLLSILIIYLFVSSNTCLAGLHNMRLLGQGDVQYLGLIKVYEASLYTQDSLGAKSVLNRNTSKCLQLEYSISLNADDFILGANTIMARQQSPEKLNQLQREIDLLHKAYRDVKKGDRYRLCYQAEDRTTTLALNERKLVAIRSADFASVYFAIWLGPIAPIDEKLRDDLLQYKRE